MSTTWASFLSNLKWGSDFLLSFSVPSQREVTLSHFLKTVEARGWKFFVALAIISHGYSWDTRDTGGGRTEDDATVKSILYVKGWFLTEYTSHCFPSTAHFHSLFFLPMWVFVTTRCVCHLPPPLFTDLVKEKKIQCFVGDLFSDANSLTVSFIILQPRKGLYTVSSWPSLFHVNLWYYQHCTKLIYIRAYSWMGFHWHM